MSWKDDIKNRIKQIRENKIIISNEFPNKDNFNKNNYRKCWITCLFVDIVGYTKMCEKSNNEEIGRIIRTFQEGVLDIMNQYELKHIQIQGDGIFGVSPTFYKNDETAKTIFNCAMDINGYLIHFWKEMDYRISLAEKEELMIIVGKNNNQNDAREVVFAGGAVNEAKNQMEDNQTNCILINDIFVLNNPKILLNNKKNESYITGKTNKGTDYSNWSFVYWK